MKTVVKRFLSVSLTVCLLLSALIIVDYSPLSLFSIALAKTYKTGDIITFGGYPQSLVSDIDTIEQLNSISKNWISYNYYTGSGNTFYDGEMQPGDWMRYADIMYCGSKYRAVTFDMYRPIYTYGQATDASQSFQDNNGYYPNNVYYFKYEPLKWRVLDPTEGLVLCESIIDVQAYQNTIYLHSSNGKVEYYQNTDCEVYANDYAMSSVRQWLNNDFYKCAFSSYEQSIIKTTRLDNSAFSDSFAQYNSKSTNDKVFLLSFDDMLNTTYGFSPNANSAVNRRAYGTDYAKCQGLISNSETEGTSCWWLRTPGSRSSDTSAVHYTGLVSCYYYTVCVSSDFGIRPALVFKSGITQTDNPNGGDGLDIALGFSNTGNALEYPIYDESSFSNQLRTWIENSEYNDIIESFMEEYSYNDLLKMGIDLPVNGGTDQVSILGNTRVKDVVAYIVFSDAVYTYMETTMQNMTEKIQEGKSGEAYQYFLKQVKNFSSQYYYFQEQLNGKDTFNQTLCRLLLANTALAAIREVKIKYKNGTSEYIILNKSGKTVDEYIEEHIEDISGTIEGKSISYVTDLYKADITESPELYDSVSYYLMSGGDSTYLNEYYQDVLAAYNQGIKGVKYGLKIKKGEATISSTIDFALDNLSYFADKFDSPSASKIKQIKNQWGWVNSGYDLFKAMTGGGLFSVGSAAWSLSNKYINEVKKVFTNAQNAEAGWYALAYYYLQLNNENLLNAMIDPNTGSAEFRINSLVQYGFPYNQNDIIENSIVRHWYGDGYNGAFLNHTYTPNQEFRFYLWNACNTLCNIQKVDCKEYIDYLLRYILAELNLKKNNTGAPIDFTVTSNDESLGQVNTPTDVLLGETATLFACPNGSAEFKGWKDLVTGEILSTSNPYTFTVYSPISLEGQFAPRAQEYPEKPTISKQPISSNYYLGQTVSPLTIQTAVTDNGQISIAWYQNNTNSNVGGNQVGSGSSYTPIISEAGKYYYYAVATNSLNGNVSNVRSDVAVINVSSPIITGIEILHLPDRTNYYLNEKLDETGMVIVSRLSDASAFPLSSYELNYCFDSTGDAVVSVTAYGFMTSFNVTISASTECSSTGHTLVADKAIAATCSSTGLTAGTHCSVCGAVLAPQEIIPMTAHIEGDPVVEDLQEPTCLDNGFFFETFYCIECSTLICTDLHEIPASGHKWNDWVELNETQHQRVCLHDSSHVEADDHCWEVSELSIKPTCTTDGERVCVCPVCGASKNESVSALGHSFEAWEVTKPATCTENGEETRKCSLCDATETRGIEALGHNFVDHSAKAATCTEKGWDSYQTCTRCDYTTFKEIAALGHDFINHEAKAATCSEKGWDSYQTCSRCNYTTYEEISVLGHDLINHEARAATCTEKGWKAYQTCSRCDYTTYEEISVLGHDLINHEAKAATCSEKGWDSYQTCSRCDYTTYEEISVLGHDLINHEAKAATCTEKGWKAYQTCSRCDYSSYEEIIALGHDYDDWTVSKEPTCSEEGEMIRVCKNDKNHIEKLTLSIVEHKDGNNDGACDFCGLEMAELYPSETCPLCGKYHSGFNGRIILFFHKLVYRFKEIFSRISIED